MHELNPAGRPASIITMVPIIQDVQKIRRDFVDISPPSCARGASNLIVNGLDNFINGYIASMGYEDTLWERKLRKGEEDFSNGMDQLTVLLDE